MLYRLDKVMTKISDKNWKNTLLRENCKSILQTFSQAIKKVSLATQTKWEFGYPVSLEAVNRIS